MSNFFIYEFIFIYFIYEFIFLSEIVKFKKFVFFLFGKL